MRISAKLSPNTLAAVSSAGIDPAELVVRCIRRAFFSFFFSKGVPTSNSTHSAENSFFCAKGVPTSEGAR